MIAIVNPPTAERRAIVNRRSVRFALEVVGCEAGHRASVIAYGELGAPGPLVVEHSTVDGATAAALRAMAEKYEAAK